MAEVVQSCSPDIPIRVEDRVIPDTRQDQFQSVNSNSSSGLNLKLAWSGDYQSLKNFVKDELNIDGKWTSPGGEKKHFTSEYVEISWWMNKKYMVIDDANAKCVVHSLLQYVGENYGLSDSKSKTSEAKHCSPCSCSELSTDIEGLKLDLTVVEAVSQQNKAGISEINQEIRDKLNGLVHQYKKQEEVNGLVDDANDMSSTKSSDQQWQRQIEEISESVIILQSDVERNKQENY